MSEQLTTYLNDHLGGASAGVELARRLEEAAKDGAGRGPLDGLTAEIGEDIETLRAALRAIGGSTNPVKRAAGWVAEKAHGIGVAVDTPMGDNDLARLLEADSLSLGVEGKRCLWLALIEVAEAYPKLAELDLPRLADRAREQRRRIEAVRLAAARRAFTPANQVVG